MILNELERAVLTKLLEGEHPLLAQLREQLPHCRVSHRELTGHGFFAYLNVGDAPGADDVKLRFGDVVAEIDGMLHGAGFLLFVDQGLLTMLEGYGYDDPWPSGIMGFTLKYTYGEKRDWAALRKDLAK
jgi:hypothetical protein